MFHASWTRFEKRITRALRELRKQTVRIPTATEAPGVGAESSRFFEFGGYKIPLELVHSTGGGPETFEHIIEDHFRMVREEIGFSSEWNIVEIGCGIGRDAMPMTRFLSSRGSYLGTDVIKRSIDWCADNITRRYPHFRFEHVDVMERWYNPKGTVKMSEVKISVADNSTDLILLHSVFTHMLEEDVRFYLKEFHRILKPGGRILASVFVVDEAIRVSAQKTKYLQFSNQISNDCFVENAEHPTQAVGYRETALLKMLEDNGLTLAKPILYGIWSGHYPAPKSGGQDVLVIAKN